MLWEQPVECDKELYSQPKLTYVSRDSLHITQGPIKIVPESKRHLSETHTKTRTELLGFGAKEYFTQLIEFAQLFEFFGCCGHCVYGTHACIAYTRLGVR